MECQILTDNQAQNVVLPVFPPEHMFESWDALYAYLDDIDSNPNYVFTEADKKRWLFNEGDHMLTEKELDVKYYSKLAKQLRAEYNISIMLHSTADATKNINLLNPLDYVKTAIR